MKYGIIGAMDSEVKLLTDAMINTSVQNVAGLSFYEGELCGQQTVVVKCGVGKVNAACCAQLLCDRFAVDALINVGVAGGVSSQLSVQDVVVGTSLVQHDFDLRPFGYVQGYLGSEYGGDGQCPTVFESDKALVERCFDAAKVVLGEEHSCFCGVIASGDVFVAATEQRSFISETFHAMAAEMEGAAIAQVATQNNIPFVVLRTISDLADGSAPVSFDAVVTFAADMAAKVIIHMLCHA